MKKVRVFELAREFGMKGPELAKLLREIGCARCWLWTPSPSTAVPHRALPASSPSARAAGTTACQGRRRAYSVYSRMPLLGDATLEAMESARATALGGIAGAKQRAAVMAVMARLIKRLQMPNATTYRAPRAPPS